MYRKICWVFQISFSVLEKLASELEKPLPLGLDTSFLQMYLSAIQQDVFHPTLKQVKEQRIYNYPT